MAVTKSLNNVPTMTSGCEWIIDHRTGRYNCYSSFGETGSCHFRPIDFKYFTYGEAHDVDVIAIQQFEDLLNLYGTFERIDALLTTNATSLLGLDYVKRLDLYKIPTDDYLPTIGTALSFLNNHESHSLRQFCKNHRNNVFPPTVSVAGAYTNITRLATLNGVQNVIIFNGSDLVTFDNSAQDEFVFQEWLFDLGYHAQAQP